MQQRQLFSAPTFFFLHPYVSGNNYFLHTFIFLSFSLRVLCFVNIFAMNTLNPLKWESSLRNQLQRLKETRRQLQEQYEQK